MLSLAELPLPRRERPMTSRRGRADFIARTITGVTGAIEQTVYNEEVARTDGLLQRADPRVKVVLCLLAIVRGRAEPPNQSSSSPSWD